MGLAYLTVERPRSFSSSQRSVVGSTIPIFTKNGCE